MNFIRFSGLPGQRRNCALMSQLADNTNNLKFVREDLIEHTRETPLWQLHEKGNNLNNLLSVNCYYQYSFLLLIDALYAATIFRTARSIYLSNNPSLRCCACCNSMEAWWNLYVEFVLLIT